jgi:hypothetical protein
MKRIVLLSVAAALFVLVSGVRADEKKASPRRDRDVKKEIKRDAAQRKEVVRRQAVRREKAAPVTVRRDRDAAKRELLEARRRQAGRPEGDVTRRQAAVRRAALRPGAGMAVQRPAIRAEVAKRMMARRTEMEKQRVQRMTHLLRRIQGVAKEEKAVKTAGAIDKVIELLTQDDRKGLAQQRQAVEQWRQRPLRMKGR